MGSSKSIIQSGTIGKHVWIGRKEPFYDCLLERRWNATPTHILKFSVEEAESLIEMLKNEIAMMRKKQHLKSLSRARKETG